MASSLLSLLPALLVILVWTLGAGLAILHLRTHPVAAVVGLLGAVLLVCTTAGTSVLQFFWIDWGMSYATSGVVYAFAALLSAVGVALLLAAAFLERP